MRRQQPVVGACCRCTISLLTALCEGDGKESTPVPTPRKSLSSPPLERARPADSQENSQPTSQRKSRFAQLARSINDWEDDLSHPTIV